MYFKEIEQKRQKSGFTIKHVSDYVGITEKTYYNWKAFRTSPDLNQLEKLAEVLNLTITIN